MEDLRSPTASRPEAAATGPEAFEFLCQMGDNALILGHRLSEWCGKGPVLEEDIALANTALDLIGHAQMWLGYAGEVEGQGRDADRLAYFRDAYDFRCCLLVQQPNGDFGQTMMRQFLFDTYHLDHLQTLTQHPDHRIAEIAAKAVKEVTYHQERSADLVIRLGDGSDESHRRMQDALDALWPFTGELPGDWITTARTTLAEATLSPPDLGPHGVQKGGITGTRHSEHLGHLLAVMQSLPRSHPDATW